MSTPERRQPTEPSTSEHELLLSLVEEGKRRKGRIADAARRASEGGESVPEALEELRAEAHALKGAAAVVGVTRLFELGRALEEPLLEAIEDGALSSEHARIVSRAARAYVEGAEAAAAGEAEPASVADSIEELTA